MKKIIVSGSNGQLGSIFKKKKSSLFKIYSFNKEELDITNYNNLEKIINQIQPNFFINTSAYTDVDASENDVNKVYKLNFEAPLNLAKLLSKKKTKLIHFSTDYVYKGKKNYLYKETDTCNPISVYGESKFKGDLSILRHNKNAIIFRISWLYSNEGKNFINKILELNKVNPILNIVDDQFGIPTYAEDLAQLIEEIIVDNKYINKKGIYNYCDDGKIVSKYDLVNYMFEILIKYNISVSKLYKVDTSYFKPLAKRPISSALDKSKFKSEFNLNGNSWKNNIEKIIKFKIKNKKL